jgi:hypothetical protein
LAAADERVICAWPQESWPGVAATLARMDITCVTIDCQDSEKVATFWYEALGWGDIRVAVDRSGPACGPPGGGLYLEFIHVPEDKAECDLLGYEGPLVLSVRQVRWLFGPWRTTKDYVVVRHPHTVVMECTRSELLELGVYPESDAPRAFLTAPPTTSKSSPPVRTATWPTRSKWQRIRNR